MAELNSTTEPSHVTGEPTAESEPIAESKPTNQAYPEAPAEPIPEWSVAIDKWGLAWEIHQYGIGAAFLIVAAFVLFVLIRIQRAGTRNHKQRWIQTIVLSLLLVFNATRSVCLFVDAYHSRKFMPRPLLQFLWGLGHPCIITAYALIFVILKNALLLKQKFQNWYTAKNIALVTVPYFLFVFAGELTFGFVPKFKGLAFACQLLYVTFGFFLSMLYAFIASLLWWKLGNIKFGTKHPGMENRGQRTRFIFRICVATAVGGFILCSLQLYGMVGVYGTFSDKKFVSPWPWYAFNTALRALELYLGVILYYVAMQKSEGKCKRIEVAPITLTSGQGKIARNQKEETIKPETISIDQS